MEEKKEIKRFRKHKVGIVVSNRMHKTVNIMVERTVMHPVFKKQVRRRKKFMAHDENNECKIGDKVRIEESRPLSRCKRWKVVEILERA